MELVIGTPKWSTWSMRPWLALKHTGADFAETLIPLRQENDMTREAILPHSPSGLVPVLKVDELVIVDSLAICEYLNDAFPAAKLWPDDPVARALGRAAAAEMHSGFQALRAECPMMLDAEPRSIDISDPTRMNVRRIGDIWSELLARFDGPYLLGEWSIADAFYAPVATRFETYQIETGSAAADAYGRRLLETPEYLEWKAKA
jgi:glutathione S-transferase